VRVRDGETVLTDGPAAELREQVGGYTIVECRDLDEALKWAATIPAAWDASIEVRAIVDTAADDLPRELTAAAAGAEGVRIGRLLGSLVRAPADLPRLIRLMRRYLAASRALATVARSDALVPHDARTDRADKS